MDTGAVIIKAKNILGICITFFCFLFTQFVLPVNVIGNTIHLYFVELFIIVLFTASVIHLLATKSKANLNKKEFTILLLFVLWFMILTVYRYFVTGNITGGFIVFRVLSFPVLLILLFKQYKITRASVFAGLYAFITYANIYQIISVMFFSKSFRQAKSLANINIYICFAIAVLPLLIYVISKYSKKNKIIHNIVRITTLFNIVCIILFSLYSGSRIAVLLCPSVSVISYFSINKFTKKSIITFFSTVLVTIVIVSGMFIANIYDAKYNFFRVVEPISGIFNLDYTIENNNSSNTTPDQTTPDQTAPDQTTPDQTLPEGNNLPQTNVSDSNGMRKALWEKSIYYIRENPIFGRHTIDIDCEMTFVDSQESVKIIESPHNFILEMWLALGLPGMLIYFAIIIFSAIKIIFSKIKASSKINFMLIMLSIFGFSFFQPLVTCWFAISLILWISLYLFTSEV